MGTFCLLRTPSGLEKYGESTLLCQKLVGKDCIIYYSACRAAELRIDQVN